MKARLLLSAAVCALLLWACNVSTKPAETLLSLELDDSLANYDSIRIDVLYPSGKAYKEAIWHGKYVPETDHSLHDLDLGDAPPANYQILVTAYRDTARALMFGVKVGPGGAEAPQVLVHPVAPDTSKPKPSDVPPVRVILVTPTPLTLAVDGQALQAKAEVQPAAADQGLLWSSSDSDAVRVDGAGMLFPGGVGEADITARSRRDTALYAVLHIRVIALPKAKGVNVAPDHALLYLGGEPVRLQAQATPPEAQVGVVFKSLDSAVARVSAAGQVIAAGEGETDVLVFPEGSPSLALACHIAVKRDAPLLESGGERRARPGDTLLFPLKVTQEYGTVAALKWDLDGDGIWDDSTNQAVAAPRRAYDGKDTLVTAYFYVRDGEGNVAQNFLYVHVGAASDAEPPAFTSATTPSPTADATPTWAWTGANGGGGRFRISLDGGPEIETRALAFTADSLPEGTHTLALRELDALGGSSPTVARAIVVVRTGPKVHITSPATGLSTKAASVEVTWSVQPLGGTAILQTGSESLAGRQGAIAIVREAFDSLGNRGSDTVIVYRDTIAPAAPAFTAETSPQIVNADDAGPVRWSWTRTGEASDVFLVSLNGAAAVPQTSTSYLLQGAVNQTYTLTVREADSLGNASAAAQYSILVDRLAPPAPTVSGTTGASGPAWTWAAAKTSDGARVFRYRLATEVAWSAETSATAYAPVGLGAGTFTLEVEERDAAGNWSAAGSAAATIP